jgi:uncharacterized phage protein (TIGR01671 family)
MKEYKFRAWDKTDKLWIEEDHFVIYPEGKFCAWLAPDEVLDEDEVELMQFIGLKDKNGVEVYFKDLIRGKLVSSQNLSIIGEVVFDENFFQIGVKNDAGITPLYSIKDIEVIGNVY